MCRFNDGPAQSPAIHHLVGSANQILGANMKSARVNKSAARRRSAEYRQRVERPAELKAPFAEYLEQFTPQSIPIAERARGRVAVIEVMKRAGHIKGLASFIKRTSDVTALVSWAIRNERSLAWNDLMDHTLISEFARTCVESGSTRANLVHRMRRLENLARAINPGEQAPPRPEPVAYRNVRRPYDAQQDAAIIRIALTQPSAKIRRQLCAVVALSRGAGVAAGELRDIRRSDVKDLGDGGLTVTVGKSPNSRTVPVRRAYESLMRIGLDGIAPNGRVLGRGAKQRNVACSIIDNSQVLGADSPSIDAARLRSTWIAELMTEPIPIAVIFR